MATKAEKKSRKRRRQNNKDVPKSELWFEMIDGNFTHQPYGYCYSKHGYLTKNLSKLHKCEEKHCARFNKVKEEELKNAHDSVRTSNAES